MGAVGMAPEWLARAGVGKTVDGAPTGRCGALYVDPIDMRFMRRACSGTVLASAPSAPGMLKLAPVITAALGVLVVLLLLLLNPLALAALPALPLPVPLARTSAMLVCGRRSGASLGVTAVGSASIPPSRRTLTMLR